MRAGTVSPASGAGNGSDGAEAPRRCCVLDIETAPDPHACVLARRARGAPRGSPLHEVVAATVLTFLMAADGSLANLDLASFHRDDYAEPDILLNVSAALADAADDGGLVATFNGRRFDLPVLATRQLRWWQCDQDAVARVVAGHAEHLDLMHEFAGEDGRWPTLADACASLGFALAGPHRPGRLSHVPREVEKCENDVVGTAVLLLYALAGRRRSDEPLRRGLPALGDLLRRVAAGRPHLERFALSPLLGEDACAWGAKAA